jgi:Dullard-like phosphatase family protein
MKLLKSKHLSHHEAWHNHFNDYFMSINENTENNFNDYVNLGLTLINLFPIIDWTEEIQKRKVSLPDLKKNFCKKTLLLDLDETLIHSEYKRTDANAHFFDLHFRPGLKQFLKWASEHFELVCFTASSKSYADTIIDKIDPNGEYFSFRLYRKSCLYLAPEIYIKDLRIIENRAIENMILIDNQIFSFANQLDNDILLSSFFTDQNDQVLRELQQYLKEFFLFTYEDIRMINGKFYNFQGNLKFIKNFLIEENILIL